MIEGIAQDVRSNELSVNMGEDFLTWLWFKIEKNNGAFETEKGEIFTVTMGDKLVVAGGDGEFKESTISSGKNSTFEEAKEGIRCGKKVSSAKLILEYNGDEWSFLVKSEDFSFTSFKTPKVAKKIQDKEDPDGAFFEKVFLVEKAFELFDSLFANFLKIKFDPGWEEEIEEIKKWVMTK